MRRLAVLSIVLLGGLGLVGSSGVAPAPAEACGACRCPELVASAVVMDGLPLDSRIFIEGNGATVPDILFYRGSREAIPFHLEPTGGSPTTAWLVPDELLPPETQLVVDIAGLPFVFTTGAATDATPPVIGRVEVAERSTLAGHACGAHVSLGLQVVDVTDDNPRWPPLVRVDVEQGGGVRTAFVQSSSSWPGQAVVVGHSEAGPSSGISGESCLGDGEIGLLRPGDDAHVTVRVIDAAGRESAPVEVTTAPHAIEPSGCGRDEGSSGGC